MDDSPAWLPEQHVRFSSSWWITYQRGLHCTVQDVNRSHGQDIYAVKTPKGYVYACLAIDLLGVPSLARRECC